MSEYVKQKERDAILSKDKNYYGAIRGAKRDLFMPLEVLAPKREKYEIKTHKIDLNHQEENLLS